MRLLSALALIVIMAACGEKKDSQPELVPKKTNYEQTSTYSDVMEVLRYVDDKMPNAVLRDFGTTPEGKKLPLLVLSDQALMSPVQARALNRPSVLLIGDIHGGEVAGKEALLKMALEFADGQHRELLNKVTVLMAPIYNADGNDAISKTHRVNQNGPFGGVGTRANAEGYNLNRDFTKLDTPEAQGLIKSVLRGWDPTVLVDLHTTNGSYHGYHMTYAPPLSPNTEDQLIGYHRKEMIPEITKTMKEHGWNTGYYGFFPKHGHPELGWIIYSGKPRYSTNYYGLRNRFALLSEAYSYLSYRKRIAVEYDFVQTVLNYAADHGSEMLDLCRQLDQQAQTFTNSEQGVQFDYAAPVRDTVLVGAVDTLDRQDVDGLTFQRIDSVRKVETKVYGRFKPVKSREVPFAYAIDNREGHYDEILHRLEWHGVPVFKTDSDQKVNVSEFIPSAIDTNRAYEHHELLDIKGRFNKTAESLKGWVLVPTNQRLGKLVFYLLEPESDDGFFRWDLFRQGVEAGKPLPVVKIPAKPSFTLLPRL